MSMRSFAAAFASLALIVSPAARADDAPTPAPTIDPLPAGWKHTTDTPEMHRGEDAALKAFFDVIAEPKDDAFADWCKSAEKSFNRKSPLSDRKDTPLTAAKIGDYNVMSYESSGTLLGSAAHIRVYFVELPHTFARLTCSCSDEHWEQSKAMLDDLVKNIK